MKKYLLIMQYGFLGKASSLMVGVFDSEEDAANFYKNRNRFFKAAMDAVNEAIKLDEDSELMRIKEIIDTGRLGLFEKMEVIIVPVMKY